MTTSTDADGFAHVEGGGESLDRRDLLVIAVVLLLAVAVRIVFSRGIFSPDETNYLRNAAAWLADRFVLKDALFLHDTRPLMFVPVAWSFAAWGVSEMTALMWPFMASVGVVVGVYLTSRRLLGREAAGYAALCAAFFPLLAQESTRLLPGVVMNLLTALCVLFFVISEQARRRRWLWLAASGAAYGAIQSAGELGIVLGLLFLAAVIMWRRYSLWSYWPAVAGFLGVTLLIALYYWAETGTPLFKIELSKNVYEQVRTVAPHQPLYYSRLLLKPLAGGGGVFYLAGIGCLAALFDRRRAALFIALWIAMTFALLEFGSISLTEYRPLSKEVRYFSVVSVPMVILAGYGVLWIRRVATRWQRGGGGVFSTGIVVAVFVLVALTSIITLHSQRERVRDQRTNLVKLRDHVRRYEGRPIYVTHWLWNTKVGYFMRFEEEYLPSGYDPYHAVHLESADSTSMNRYVQTLKPGEPMGPGLLVHDERLFEISQGETESWSIGRGEIPEVLARIPSEWRLVDRVTISERFVLALYDIPEGAVWPADGEH
ncbi:MAG: glycosyltransferase family 39 protein [Candidatus Latescibacterota bacterium]|nr:MAG: glycosyltransferase family 39 protein [Candidatus Latescibacterota bacterium]